ncbi:integrator complex subunit 5 [Hemicordylus capensis]|uniref:integrator complex subunit 5 n=1 Tax=Hemicordylus capensis TaxID=884348 RepID=UPI0023044467|nr:integrator complex subunit 5 [Hemicordylus capensis]
MLPRPDGARRRKKRRAGGSGGASPTPSLAPAGMSALCDPPGVAGPPGAAPSPKPALPAAPPSLSSQELAQEIKAFLSGVDPVHGNKLTMKEHARCAMVLLRSLPPARSAVLDHLRGVFDECVCSYLLELESGEGGLGSLRSQGPSLDDVVQEIQAVLSGFVRMNPKAWAGLVSAWSIDLMGQLSSKYAGRHGVPHASSLNELLQLWMSCKATRTLMEIYTQCLSSMISTCPDACVDALLDTSVQHSPHFDWVVAHIGSSFPNTIISRVLSCGLKDFCMHGTASADLLLFPSAAAADKRVPKIASVVGILGHLASRHSESIKQELLRMFHGSLGPARGGAGGEQQQQQQKATVPFLLQLAVMSPALLGTISAELVDSLKPGVLNQLHQHFAALPREELENVVSIVVHLICQTAGGAYRTLQFLVNTAMPASVITTPGLAVHDSVREACDRVIQLLLLNLQKLVYNRGAASLAEAPPRPVPFLDELKGRVRELCVETLRLERKRFLWQHQLLVLLSVYCSPSCASEALCCLLTLAKSQEELSLATQLYAVLSSCMSDLLPATVQTCVCQIHAGGLSEQHTAQLLQNLALATQWEGEGPGPASVSQQLSQAVSAHLYDFGQLLLHRHPQVAQAASLLLSVCPAPRAIRPAHLFFLVRAAVHHFFLVLRSQNPTGISYGSRLLCCLSGASPMASKAILQHLVEGSLHPGNAELFGGLVEPPAAGSDAGLEGAQLSLLDINRRFMAAVNFSGSVWSVFHAGVIGRGLKPPHAPHQRELEEISHNIQLFLSLLLRCCGAGPCGPEASQRVTMAVSPEAAKTVAVVLVETVCPDVTNSELTWPPEEHTRSTVERDIQVGRSFRDNPLLFQLLSLVAAGRPALCYCSVLLRGLLATLMAHWEASREGDTTSSPWHLQASCALVACMGEGQLLPPVLSNMHEIFDQLAPFEVHLLLLSVWDYVHDNSPLPQKFTFDASTGLFFRDFSRDTDVGKYLCVLHSVLHKNIGRLGLLSGRFQT